MNNGSKLLEFCRRSSEALEELGELVTGTQESEVLLALYECDFDGVLGSANAGIHKESTECVRVWEVVMEHRTLVQRSSQSVQREPCSPIMQLGDVTQSSQLQCCDGLWESSLGCAA